MYRRSFLKRMKEESDEASHRVPDPTPTVTSTQPVAANEDGEQKPSSTSPPQATLQTLQPASAPRNNTMTKTGYLSHFHWTHAVVALGLLAASGAGTALLFKKSIIPRLKSWIRKVVKEEEDEKGIVKGKPSLAEEASVAAKAVIAAAAADVARASQEMLASKSEEKRYFEEMTSLLNYQVREMKSMKNVIEQTLGSPAAPHQERPIQRSSVPPQPPPVAMAEAAADISQPKKPAAQMTDDQLLARSSEITDDLQRVTRISEAGGAPEANGSSSGLQMSETTPSNSPSPHPTSSSPAAPLQERPIQRSLVPPQPSPIAMTEAAAAISQPKKPAVQNEQVTDDQLLARSTEITDDLQRVTRISESGGAPEANGSSSGLQMSEAIPSNSPSPHPTSSSPAAPLQERPIQRSSVPPQPPSVAMTEAVAAISQPKKPAFPNEKLTDDQLLARSSEITDEFQRVTKISESGGSPEANG